MPTKKRRVGFIPRSEVLELINKLSYESNLSYSKIINILVEEALNKRGLLKFKKDYLLLNYKIKNQNNENTETKKNFNQKLNYNFKKQILKDTNRSYEEIKEEPFDNEIYAKFLMFLEFQERMKKTI